MTQQLPENLQLKVIDNKITNTDKLLLTISKTNNYNLLKEYYDFLTNHLNANEYEDLDVVLFAIKSKITSLETTKKIKKELENIKKVNKELERIELLENPKEKNDVDKDTFYLKYANSDGAITILEITNNEVLLRLITTVAPTMSSEEFIRLLKTRYFNELPTYGMGKNEINILEYEHSSNIPDKNNYKYEKEILNQDYPDIVPKVSIDFNHERLYHINNIIIKFYTDNGKRKKVILNNDSKQENLSTENVNFNKNITEHYTNNVNIPRDELTDIHADTNDITQLILEYSQGKSINNINLSKIYAFLLNALTTLETTNKLDDKETYLLGISIDQINKSVPNKVEQEILGRYNAYYSNSQNIGITNQNNQKKTLHNNNYPKNPLTFEDDAFSLTIIIITITVVVGSIISAIMLVK